MAQPLRLALAGLGTVGTGLVRLIATNGALVAARAGRPIEIVAVSARDRRRERGLDLTRFAWEDDMTALAGRADIDVVVELVGGADGPALTLARRTLGAGKALVTANKAMIAHHGMELARLAEDHAAPLRFEAAVAGGIPVVKGLAEGAAANRVTGIDGILNGTSNFILSRMEQTGADLADALAEAQAAGYAEADPTFDVEGVDAAHKLAILAAIGFGTCLDLAGVDTRGITAIRAADIAQAAALGHVVRLVGRAELSHDGADAGDASDGRDGGSGDGDGGAPRLFQRVAPCLVPRTHPLASVDGATNAVAIEGDQVGRLLFEGPGAGDGPTASAVVADLIDIARGSLRPAMGVSAGSLVRAKRAEAGERRGRTYIRFLVADRPGVLARIAAAMRDADVSIESLSQPGSGAADSASGQVLVAMVTHDAPERAIAHALRLLEDAPDITEPPLVMRLVE